MSIRTTAACGGNSWNRCAVPIFWHGAPYIFGAASSWEATGLNYAILHGLSGTFTALKHPTIKTSIKKNIVPSLLTFMVKLCCGHEYSETTSSHCLEDYSIPFYHICAASIPSFAFWRNLKDAMMAVLWPESSPGHIPIRQLHWPTGASAQDRKSWNTQGPNNVITKWKCYIFTPWFGVSDYHHTEKTSNCKLCKYVSFCLFGLFRWGALFGWITSGLSANGCYDCYKIGRITNVVVRSTQKWWE